MRRVLLVLVGVVLPLLASAQVHKSWVKTWSGPDSYGLGRGLAVDDSANVYVTGSTTISGSFGTAILKYSPDGRLLWEKFSWGTPRGIATDGSSGVYVVGTMFSGSTPIIVLIKYHPNGEEAWSWASGGPAGASDIGIDRSGNVYVSGWRRSGSPTVHSLLVVKFSPSGDLLWIGADVAERYIENVQIAVADTAVYICSPCQGVTYLAAFGQNGTHLWSRRYGSFSQYTPGYWGDIGVDKEGTVYFTSCKPRDATPALGDCVVGAYSSDGGFLWESIWQCSSNGMSSGGALTVDTSMGSVYVTGLYYPDFQVNVKRSMTMKHDPGGSQLWVQTYVGAGGWDRCDDIAIDHKGNVYVAGFTDLESSGSICLLIKYGPGGEVKWLENYSLVPGDNTWVGVVVDRSANVYVSGNVTTTLTPYTTLIATAKYSQKGKFRPARDGWRFANNEDDMWPEEWWSRFDYTQSPYPYFFTWPPMNAGSADYPDWPLFLDVFGVDQCFKKSAGGVAIYSPKALLSWRVFVEGDKVRDTTGNVKSHFGGACGGFCRSGMRYYHDLLSLKRTLGDWEDVYHVPLNDASRYLVNKHHLLNSGMPNVYWKPGPGRPMFDTLRQMMNDSTYHNTRTLGIEDVVTGDAHEVVACSLSAVGSGFWELSIYDPNNPGVYMHLNYQEVTEEWTAQEEGWNAIRLGLSNPIGEFSLTPILPDAAKPAAIPLAVPGDSCSTFNSPYVNIRIEDSSGQAIGWADGVLIENLPGAHPRLHFGGRGHPPDGYFLPSGAYTAQIGKSRDSTTYFALFLDDAAFSFHRQGATANDIEILRLSTAGRSFSVANPGPAAKALFLQSIESVLGEETVCRLHVRAMPPADSLGIQLAGNRNVALVVGAAGMTADLRLELAKDFANPVFEYADLALEGGASYLVTPLWDSLASMPLPVYVDRDRDGTVDDTLRLENQATDVPRGRPGEIPDRFELHQNYPNPFNPTTEIRYQVSGVSDVKLSVFDILGREVSVLVNERKNAGSYEVRFDAAGLSSGAYFYRLQAGDFVQSRMMLLLR